MPLPHQSKTTKAGTCQSIVPASLLSYAADFDTRASHRSRRATKTYLDYLFFVGNTHVLQGFGGVGGSFSLYLLVGLLFIGPAIGFLIGGILDRAFETFLHRSWSKSLAQAAIGVGLCVGLLFAIDAAAYCPSPTDAAREARAVLVTTWRERDNGAKVRDVTLTRSGRWTYTGFVNVSVAGIQERMQLDVEIKDGRVSVQWRPLDE